MRAATDRTSRALVLTAYLSYAISSTGCSDAQRIADATIVARRNAESSHGRFVWIEGNATDVPGVKAQAAAGADEQVAIIAATEGIVRALPGVKDVTPWWANLIGWGLIALAIIGIVALLWMTGIGSFLRQLLASVAGLIPRRQRREADLAVKVMDEASPEGIREYIAARRASDPMFDAAYSKAAKDRYGRMPHTGSATMSATENTPHATDR
jgi:hypothetical protein